ncbi:hypothetical protein BDV95DRAFT_349589 [Massariosphaeria phaeospora]|uniref:Uncharacterized protein n=1 Tax=Massariosphaeria phaeospora TaxID=100035 RepID=A0A7C8IDM6_9PLEO|nr:hypothetical protein BDV95DRAFT_349589 [Massariosphaeria phaeospora]
MPRHHISFPPSLYATTYMPGHPTQSSPTQSNPIPFKPAQPSQQQDTFPPMSHTPTPEASPDRDEDEGEKTKRDRCTRLACSEHHAHFIPHCNLAACERDLNASTSHQRP